MWIAGFLLANLFSSQFWLYLVIGTSDGAYVLFVLVLFCFWGVGVWYVGSLVLKGLRERSHEATRSFLSAITVGAIGLVFFIVSGPLLFLTTIHIYPGLSFYQDQLLLIQTAGFTGEFVLETTTGTPFFMYNNSIAFPIGGIHSIDNWCGVVWNPSADILKNDPQGHLNFKIEYFEIKKVRPIAPDWYFACFT